jgi:carboxymethylenebutenolidase
MTAAVQGHNAEDDQSAGPEAVAKLESELGRHGIRVEMFLYPGTRHAFFNDQRPEVHDPDAARQAWERTIAFLHSTLG